MSFDAPAFAWLLLLVPLLAGLFAWSFRQRRRALAAFTGREATAGGGGRGWARAVCLLLAVAGLVVALMQPRFGQGEAELPLRGRDIVVVLDVSLSMLAEDALPNRLERAKASVRTLIEAVRAEGGHRVGLLTFAGRADVHCPLTRDYDLFLERLEDASPERVARRGTAIGEALLQAGSTFGDLDPAHTDVILVSDGEDHGSGALADAERMVARGITLYTVGIGDAGRGSPIPIAAEGEGDHLVHEGQEVLTRMQESLLAGIAATGGGAFVTAAAGPARLDDLYAGHIAGAPRREIGRTRGEEATPRFQLFVLLAVLLLGAEMGLRAPARATR